MKKKDRLKIYSSILALKIEDIINLAKGARYSRWINVGSFLQIYVRATSRFIEGNRLNTIEIASVSIVKTRRSAGLFTDVILPTFESVAVKTGRIVFVESVQELRFQEFFKKKGYTEISDGIVNEGTEIYPKNLYITTEQISKRIKKNTPIKSTLKLSTHNVIEA